MSSSIRIGILTATEGAFAEGGEDALRGAKIALEDAQYKVAGKQIDVTYGATNIMPDIAYQVAEDLIENKGVDFIIGPLSGTEGLAVRNYALTQPEKAFVNGTSGAQDATLRNQAENFFNFTTNGAQMMYGLAKQALEMGYKTVATIGENYSYPHDQVGAFTVEYTRLGGVIKQRSWVPVMTPSYTDVLSQIPNDVDALLVALTGLDGTKFLEEYQAADIRLPFIAGTSFVDVSTLSSLQDFADILDGTITAGPIPPIDHEMPSWVTFKQKYVSMFPDAFDSPGLFAYGYYLSTTAALTALASIDGDLSKGHDSFKQALQETTVDGPCGKITLNHNRQATGPNFVKQVVKGKDSTLREKVVEYYPEVNQTLNLPEDEYLAIGPFSDENPALEVSR